MKRQGALEIIEGAFLGHAVFWLHREGVFDRIGARESPASIAEVLGCDAEALAAVLAFVAEGTGLLRRRPGGYRLAPEATRYGGFGFHLDKFLGAYGPPVAALGEALRAPALGGPFVDRGRLAAAFARAEQGPAASPVASVVRARGVTSLLDLGSGSGKLLCDLAAGDAAFRGVGVDASEAMCAAARRRVAAAGLGDRVRVIAGDARRIGSLLRPSAREHIQSLHAGSLLNELFRGGPSAAVALLRKLRTLFPGRLLFVTDYYGRLGRAGSARARDLQAILQDFVQAVSGQGVPPPDLASWRAVYEAAGCAAIEAFEGAGDRLAWFIHVVRLC